MNQRPEDLEAALEARLRAMTTWEGEAPKLSAVALAEESHARRGVAGVLRMSPSSLPRIAAILLVVFGGMVVIGALMLPSLGKARSVRPKAPEVASSEWARGDADRQESRATDGDRWRGGVPPASGPPAAAAPSFDNAPDFDLQRGIRGSGAGSGGATRGVSAGGAAAPVQVEERAVVRRASLDLAAGDVRAAFNAVIDSISAAQGEYVEESRLAGEGDDARATLKLRVRSERLDDVLNRLRPIGTILNEQSSGEDVTNQLVDLDARLRNERRLEQELLGLLESREKAPLKEVLELRDQIAQVRLTIEQLAARQQGLSRLVELSTISVSIQPPAKKKSAAAPEPAPSYLAEHMHAAWENSQHSLVNSAGFLIEFAIGGLPWWCLLVVGGFCVRAVWRRQVATGRI